MKRSIAYLLLVVLAAIGLSVGCYQGDPGYGLCTPSDPGCTAGGTAPDGKKIVRASGGQFATYPINLASTSQVSGPISVPNATLAPTTISALNIDWSTSNVFSKTLAGGGNTFTFSNARTGQAITAILTGSASTVTWPSVKWAGGAAPTQTASGVDAYTFIDLGGTFYGSVVQDLR